MIRYLKRLWCAIINRKCNDTCTCLEEKQDQTTQQYPVENVVCNICGHSTVVVKGRVTCLYCENFYEDTRWIKHRQEKDETTNRKTKHILKRFIR